MSISHQVVSIESIQNVCGNRDLAAPDLSALSIHRRYRIFVLFSAAIRRLTSSEFFRDTIDEAVTDAQADALRFLLLNEHMSMGDIAYGLGYTISGATKAINRLEQKGWVLRGSSSEDQREVYVSLTPRGRELALQVLAATGERVDALFEKMPHELIQRLEGVLEEFIENFVEDESIARELCVACGFEGGIECSKSEVECVVAKTSRRILNGDDDGNGSSRCCARTGADSPPHP